MTTRAKITATQDETFLARPENADRRFELVFGEIEEKCRCSFTPTLFRCSADFYLYSCVRIPSAMH